EERFRGVKSRPFSDRSFGLGPVTLRDGTAFRSRSKMQRIYLDNAATTRIDPEVFEAMVPYMSEFYGNPSSIHAFGRRTRAGIEQARRTVAKLLNCAPGEIIFTSGGTEADNMAIRCAVRDLGVRTIISSPIEHHAVEMTVNDLNGCGDAKAIMVRLNGDG